MFLAKEHKVSLGEYSITNPSFIEYISFVFNTFIPLITHDDINMLLFNVKKLLGIIPKPTHNKKLIVDFVYKKINDIVTENGSKLVIVGLGGVEKLDIPNDLYKLPNVTVVNTRDALMERVRTFKEYYIKYSHIRGNNPLVIVDIHP
ncbi:MAG: hypothetical protein HYR97_08040, partial [Candidatus Melainabacteria bacterium]|nr:hypothetical protein [Candidatus Melainabacteria bacterium]